MLFCAVVTKRNTGGSYVFKYSTIKRRSRVVQVFPSEKSLLRLAGAVMCDQDEAWSEARYFSAAKMAELHDEQKPEPAEPPSAERREQVLAFARQAIEASLELADRMEAA